MRVKRFIMNCLDSNSYLVYGNENCYLVDIGGNDIEKITDFIEENNLKLNGVFLTHGHIDHIAGLSSIIEKYPDIKIYISEIEEKLLYDKMLNLAVHFAEFAFNFNGKKNVVMVKEGDVIDFKFQIISTPGHTAGSISIYMESENVIFTGDTLFKSSIGRTDLPTSDYKEIWKSLKKLVEYPENTVVLPGHGDESIIKRERKNLFEDEEDF